MEPEEHSPALVSFRQNGEIQKKNGIYQKNTQYNLDSTESHTQTTIKQWFLIFKRPLFTYLKDLDFYQFSFSYFMKLHLLI